MTGGWLDVVAWLRGAVASMMLHDLVAGTAILALGLLAWLLHLRQVRGRNALLRSLKTELADRERIEAALRESEVFYPSLVESLPQSILRKDLEGRFTFANRRFLAALGESLEGILGKTDFDYFPRELAEKYRHDDLQVITSGQTLDVIERFVAPHGEAYYVQVLKTPLRAPDGRCIGIQGIFWDVTERQRAEERLQEQNLRLQEMARSEREAHDTLKVAQCRMAQSEKLISLGQMITGVAHEINNPLSYVTNNVAVLERDLGDLGTLMDLYRQLEDAAAAQHPACAMRSTWNTCSPTSPACWAGPATACGGSTRSSPTCASSPASTTASCTTWTSCRASSRPSTSSWATPRRSRCGWSRT